MPELPEVQTTVNGIQKSLKGLVIRDVWTDYGGIIHRGKNHIKNTKYFEDFRRKIIGKKILGSTRRAKNVLIHLSGPKSPNAIGQGNLTILVHMKMTGHLLYGKYKKHRALNIEHRKMLHASRSKFHERWVAVATGPLRDDSYNQFIHLVFSLSNNKHLVLSDVRKFAKVCLIKTDEIKTSAELSHLGPEPLEKNFQFSRTNSSNLNGQATFMSQLLKRPSGKIKQVLMDQSIIAGIGNIYSDEILWVSSVHPLRRVKTLKPKELKEIFKNIKRILKKGIDFRGDSLSDYRNLDGKRGRFQYEHRAYQQTGKRCPKKGCRGIIKRIVVGGRSAHFCPMHQK